MSFADVGQISLHYEQAGPPAGPPVVFINSLGTDLHLWDALVPAFAGPFRVLRYDKRGHGQSQAPPAPYTLTDHARDLGGLIEQLGVKLPILIGISVGGLVAMEYVLRHRAEAAALVLCDTAPRIGTPEGWTERMQAVREQGLPAMAGLIMGRWFAPTFAQQHPDQFTKFRDMLVGTPVEGYIGTCAALRDADLTGRVSAIAPPTLLLCGADDMATPPDLMRNFAGSLPDARLQIIAGAAHLACVEQPERMAELIRVFLGGLGYV